MAKVDNPYSKILVNVEDAISLHKIEYSRIMRNFLESQLEEKVHMLENHPMVAEIKAQEKLTEEDQILLDTNAFSLSYQREKLLAYKNYEKDYKKFTEVAFQLKGMIKEANEKLTLNSAILSKFTEEEVKKDAKLRKMATYVPNGYDSALTKFNELDLSLSVNYSTYISKNNEDLTVKLMDFLEESKNFRSQLLSMFKTKNEDKKVVEKPQAKSPSETSKQPTKLFGDNRGEFEFLRQALTSASVIYDSEYNDAKFYLSLALSGDELAEFNRFEEAIISLHENNASLSEASGESNEDWKTAVNKILTNCIFEAIDEVESGNNPVDVVQKYTDRYIPKGNKEETGTAQVQESTKSTKDIFGKSNTSFVKKIIQ